ncbi:MAG: tetratricopeptide repeat protein, partial [Vicinamibacterales bacterium]
IDTNSDMTGFRHLPTWAEAGDAEAQCQLGLRYANGIGVTQNYVEAVRWYRLAAEQGHAGGQNALAGMYAAGRGHAVTIGDVAARQRCALSGADAWTLHRVVLRPAPARALDPRESYTPPRTL